MAFVELGCVKDSVIPILRFEIENQPPGKLTIEIKYKRV